MLQKVRPTNAAGCIYREECQVPGRPGPEPSRSQTETLRHKQERRPLPNISGKRGTRQRLGAQAREPLPALPKPHGSKSPKKFFRSASGRGVGKARPRPFGLGRSALAGRARCGWQEGWLQKYRPSKRERCQPRVLGVSCHVWGTLLDRASSEFRLGAGAPGLRTRLTAKGGPGSASAGRWREPQ